MRLSHRARLSVVSAVTTGGLLACVFSGVVYESRRSSLGSVQSLLNVALRQAKEGIVNSPKSPRFADVAEANPEITLAAFRKNGELFAQTGALLISPNLPSGEARLESGEPVIVAWTRAGDARVAAALPWRHHEAALARLAVLLAILWAPLTAFAALTTWLASRATFRPLEELARQAEAMSSGSLAQRLKIPEGEEFADFAARLNRFLDRLEDSITKQERFVQDAAHELRTPLAVVRGRIETTLKRHRTEDEYRAALRTVLDEAERLSQLVEVLLQSAAPDQGVAEPIDLAEAVERSHARWVDRFEEAGVVLALEAETAWCEVRDTEIEVTIDNLLSNALRSSPAGSACRLASIAAADCAKVVVQDEGKGISEEDADRIFERFTRADDGRSRNQGGFGIGLAVCRRLVSLRGGRIYAEPVQRGARFIVEFPTVATPAVAGRPPLTPASTPDSLPR